ncbi:MAG: hypothetical protein NTV49_02925 [Kiritimatiellaeota bacterium]|nr:hypothetical protein [Kiritimatiellota bacterium]
MDARGAVGIDEDAVGVVVAGLELLLVNLQVRALELGGDGAADLLELGQLLRVGSGVIHHTEDSSLPPFPAHVAVDEIEILPRPFPLLDLDARGLFLILLILLAFLFVFAAFLPGRDRIAQHAEEAGENSR